MLSCISELPVLILVIVLGTMLVAGQSWANPNASSPSERNDPAATRGKVVYGTASWYGPGFRGHETASGEIFNPDKPTAASTQLPLGTHAVVTNRDNGRSVKVRINDCGPHVKGRKIDLSKKAAEKIHMTRTGTAPVKIKVVQVPPDATTCTGTKEAGRQP
jgi:rare lipoprotein A